MSESDPNEGLRTNLRSDYKRDAYDDFIDKYIWPIVQDPMVIFRKIYQGLTYVLHAEFMTKDRWWERVGNGLEMGDPNYVSVDKENK